MNFKEIRLLKIENSTIEVEGFRKISNTNYTVNKLIKFFKNLSAITLLFIVCLVILNLTRNQKRKSHP